MRLTMTIAGLYNYNPKVFDRLNLPAGVDRDTVVFHIIEECGTLEIMFPSYEYLRDSIYYWSKGALESWTRYWTAINKDYDPLNNYDRTESVSEETGGESVNAATAFNEDSFKDTDKTSGTGTRTLNSRTYGNIGVTTSQQMLEAELTLTPKLDFYKHIADCFKVKYCVLIY